MREEIKIISLSRGIALYEISEIRLRASARNSIIMRGERIVLSSQISSFDISKSFSLMCEGAVYAQRETIKDGYVTILGGIRVGICGQARYDGGALVGISNLTSLVFRIPTQVSFDIEPLYRAWKESSRGMLIYSAPGVGKTTALRHLCQAIGGGRHSEQVAVVDERCEFLPEDYQNASVDILRGYKRADGMDIALRTMSPSVIVVDEIGRKREADAMLESLNSGVKLLASAHASSFSELSKRISLKPFFENRIFDVYAGVEIKNGARHFTIEEKKN